MALSVVVPTLGRDTLKAALTSVALQTLPEDEVFVVADPAGDPKNAYRIFLETAPLGEWRFDEVASDEFGNGNTQRNWAIRQATNSHLCFLDDDDIYVLAAFDLFREAARDVPVIFKASHWDLGVIWTTPSLVYGNIDTAMMLVPNRPGHMGTWRPHLDGHGSDFTFLTGCCAKMGHPYWRSAVVSVLRPDEQTFA